MAAAITVAATVSPKRSASTGSLSPSVRGRRPRWADCISGSATKTASSPAVARPISTQITDSTNTPRKWLGRPSGAARISSSSRSCGKLAALRGTAATRSRNWVTPSVVRWIMFASACSAARRP